ncbi:MAG: hypothetical protein RLZZ546_2882 [Bacteroidota bacterium]|jgi:hypothetical protein
MEDNNVNLEGEDIQPINAEAEEKTQEKEITSLPYQFIFENIYENAKVLGQVVFVDSNSQEDKLSNTVSVIRMLSNGEKQFFKITVEETKELTLKK